VRRPAGTQGEAGHGGGSTSAAAARVAVAAGASTVQGLRLPSIEVIGKAKRAAPVTIGHGGVRFYGGARGGALVPRRWAADRVWKGASRESN
jgi:hypothetical protein